MVTGSYFDGRTTRVRPVTLSVVDDVLVVKGEGVDLHIPAGSLKVDERLGRAPRRLRFGGGGFCEVRDLDALDALLAAIGHRDSHVDRLQRTLAAALAACVACVGLAILGYEFALPAATARLARAIPAAAVTRLSAQTLKSLDGNILRASQLTPERQEALTASFHGLQLPEGGTPTSALLMRRSPYLGANAFTLPDGTIIMLDELVTLIDDDRQIVAVLAHELGHVRGRHSLQLLLRSTVVGAFWSILVGDLSQILAAAPTVVVQARYSRDLEREADDYGAAVLIRNGMSPELLAQALEKLWKAHPGSANWGYLASHPRTDERIRHLRALAASHPAAVQGER